MSDIFAARSQMAMSLVFHIIFAAIGVALPLMMVIAEGLWLRTHDAAYLCVAKRWAKGTAILFAVGAVSGTVLSFELGLLWPRFMGFAGAAIGMPFSLEGFAFFTEAIFLGIYLYGWKRVSPGTHLLAGAIVAVSGLASAMFVCLANGWMNTPTGFRLVNGQLTDINVWQALRNPAGLPQAIHMILASYCAAGFATAGVHALLVLRDRSNRFHQRAIAIALLVGGSAAVLQAVSGDALARMTARNLPTKLAAMEGDFDTRSGAPLRIGGLPDVRTRQTKYSIEIPDGLSLLAFHSPHATVEGLDKTPREEWPNVLVVHIAFQIMVGIGTLLICVSLFAAWLTWKRGPLIESPLSAIAGALQSAGVCGAGVRVGGHGGWPPTLDHLPHHENLRCGDDDAGPDHSYGSVHRPLPDSGSGCDMAHEQTRDCQPKRSRDSRRCRK